MEEQPDKKLPTGCLSLFYTDAFGNQLPGIFTINYDKPPRPYNHQEMVDKGHTSGTIIKVGGNTNGITIATEYINPLTAPVVLGDLLYQQFLYNQHITKKTRYATQIKINGVVRDVLDRFGSIRAYPVFYEKDGRISSRPDEVLQRLAA